MKFTNSGFTLLELMVTIAVLGILLGFGLPNFRAFILNGRMTAAANDLLTDITTARTEAIKRRAMVNVCASTDPTATSPACAAAGATSFRGWLVFVDTDADGTVDSGELVLRRHELLESGMTAKSDTGFISFPDTGFARAIGTTASATRIVICDARGNVAAGGAGSAARGVTISRTGRAGITRSVADITALSGC